MLKFSLKENKINAIYRMERMMRKTYDYIYMQKQESGNG